jgi:hypothetical protein
MTASKLQSYTCKDLAQMAKSEGVSGWHSMRKDELIQALIKHAKNRKRRRDATPAAAAIMNPPRTSSTNGGAANRLPASRADEQLRHVRARLDAGRDLAFHGGGGQPKRSVERDRLVVMVRDPYWLQAYWELMPQSVDRARSALGQFWHTSHPVLRLYKLAKDGSATLDRNLRIHGGVSHWYVEVHDPPAQYRMEIGYLGGNDQFYCLARSNSVTTPQAGTSDAVDENWADVADNADRIFAMSGGYSPRGTSMELQELMEERLGRPMGTPMETRFGNGAARVPSGECLRFCVDAELLVYGVSQPNSHVTLQGEPVLLRPDGTFVVRMSLADRRQVIPVVASSADGLEQRTIILAIERNTKVLEPRIRDLAR